MIDRSFVYVRTNTAQLAYSFARVMRYNDKIVQK